MRPRFFIQLKRVVPICTWVLLIVVNAKVLLVWPFVRHVLEILLHQYVSKDIIQISVYDSSLVFDCHPQIVCGF